MMTLLIRSQSPLSTRQYLLDLASDPSWLSSLHGYLSKGRFHAYVLIQAVESVQNRHGAVRLLPSCSKASPPPTKLIYSATPPTLNLNLVVQSVSLVFPVLHFWQYICTFNYISVNSASQRRASRTIARHATIET